MNFSTIVFFTSAVNQGRQKERGSGMGGNSKSGQILVIARNLSCRILLPMPTIKSNSTFQSTSFKVNVDLPIERIAAVSNSLMTIRDVILPSIDNS